MPDSILTHLPPETRRVFENLLALELQPSSVLQNQVDRHLAELEEAHERNEFLDLATARRLAHQSHGLLARFTDAPEDRQRLIQAAVLYFVLDRDASPDSRSLLGLEDDERVLRAVASHLEAP